ncbi:SCA7, zinc-binding domain-containing protein [Pyronema omphalodes]|nr:SCA7, zinc-binding domain-containing protein [Pyronema omphalodes]
MTLSGSSKSSDVMGAFKDSELGGTIKLKNSTVRNGKKPTSNWKERAKQLEEKEKEATSSPTRSPGPVVTQLDDKDVATFATGRPLQDDPDYKVCKHCKKPVLKTVAAEHVRACYKAKTERNKERKKQREEAAAVAAGKGKEEDTKSKAEEEKEVKEKDEPSAEAKKKVTGAKKMAKKDTESGAKGKKRKADTAAIPKEPKAKKKKEKPAKPEPKPKAPVDVERQCGVQLPNGALCARSLTCKSHSMGSKRGVLGRSQPYDVLLAAYQKKNQAKQQKAAINAGNPPPEEIEANALPVDSDEETELVMAAITTHVPQPFEHNLVVPLRKKAQYIRMRDAMASALRPVGTPHPLSATGMPDGVLGGVFGRAPQPKAFQPPPPPIQRKSSINMSGQ